MTPRPLSEFRLLLAAAAVLVAAAGCDETVELARDAVDTGPVGDDDDADLDDGGVAEDAGILEDAGIGCVGHADCGETDRCRDGRCVPDDALCGVESTACIAAGDCCNGLCDGDRCRNLRACQPTREACAVDDDCCSGACEDDGAGARRCVDLGGCLPAGELCWTDQECCNAVVDDAVCEPIEDGRGLGRCRNPPGCAPPGERCGLDGEPHECCDEIDLPDDDVVDLACVPSERVPRVRRCARAD